MSDTVVKPRTKVRPKVERPRLHKVILLNDDYTPRDFVVVVLKAVFGLNKDQAYRVMYTAHSRGTCVVAVYTKTSEGVHWYWNILSGGTAIGRVEPPGPAPIQQ